MKCFMAVSTKIFVIGKIEHIHSDLKNFASIMSERQQQRLHESLSLARIFEVLLNFCLGYA